MRVSTFSPDAVLVLDGKARFIHVDIGFLKWLGREAKDFVGKTIQEISPPLMSSESTKDILQAIKWREKNGEQKIELKVDIIKSGILVPMACSISIIRGGEGDTGLEVISLRDITERKRAEDARNQSEERYRGLMEALNEGFDIVDENGRFTYVNDKLCEMLGYSREEILGRHVSEFIEKASEEIFKEQRQRRGTGERGVFELIWPAKDGHKVFTVVSATPILDENGAFKGSFGVIMDISERKRMEEELKRHRDRLEELVAERTADLNNVNEQLNQELAERKLAELKLQESEKKYRELYESVTDGISMFDVEGHFIECNQTYLEILGYTREELEKVAYQQLTPEKWREIEANIVKNQVFGRGHSDEYEKEYIRKDGTFVPVSVKSWMIKDESGKPTGSWAIVRDITERKNAEKSLRDSIYKINDIHPGDCYLHSSRDASFKIFSQFVRHGVPGLCISRERPEKLLQHDISKENIIIMSSSPMKGFETIDDLQNTSRKISEFLVEHTGGVVMLDGLVYLISRSGFEAVYKFIQEKRFSLIDANANLLMPIDLATITDKEKAMLTSEVKLLG